MRVLFAFRNSEWLGIEYLSAALKRAGHSTELLYHPGCGEVEREIRWLNRLQTGLGIEKLMLRRAERFEPDLIAFSSTTTLFPWVKSMARYLKDRLQVPVLVGGIHPTVAPEHVLAQPGIDILCLGEGEQAIVELVESMSRGEDRTDIPNLWFKRGDTIIRNEIGPLIEDLDSLPYPDKDIYRPYGIFQDRLHVMTSRGCPYSCSYCFHSYYHGLHKGKGKYYRRHSVTRVIEEILHFRRKLDFNEIYFYDDIFTIHEKWVHEFAKAYKGEVHIPFKMLVYPEWVREDTMKLLKEAGCYYVDLGVESGSRRVREELMNRPVRDKAMMRAAEVLHKLGIKFASLNIFGTPGETEQEMRETYELNMKMKPTGAIGSILYPFPKTASYQYAKTFGYLDPEGDKTVMEGLGSYKGIPVTKIPHANLAVKYMRLLPLLVKTPRWMHPLVFRLPYFRVFDFLLLPFVSIWRNFHIRSREFIGGLFGSWRSYLTEEIRVAFERMNAPKSPERDRETCETLVSSPMASLEPWQTSAPAHRATGAIVVPPAP